MKQIINGRLVLPDGVVEGKVLIFDKYIREIADAPIQNAETVDAGGNYVIPGLIDLHIHGYAGHDATDGDEGGIEKIARGVLKNGVTAFLPTTMTQSYEVLEKAFDATRSLKNRQKSDSLLASESADMTTVLPAMESFFICLNISSVKYKRPKPVASLRVSEPP